MMSGLKLACMAALIALLAACGGSPNSEYTPLPHPKSAKKEAQELSASVDAAPRDVTRAVARNPKRLLGLSRANLTALLGAPRFVRRDSSTQLWRYRNKSCVLHVFFYPSKEQDRAEMTVRHYEAHSARGAPVVASDCLSELLAARR